jgi:hypothetical protein
MSELGPEFLSLVSYISRFATVSKDYHLLSVSLGRWVALL